MHWNALHNRQTKDCGGGRREIVCTDRDFLGVTPTFETDMESSIKKKKKEKKKTKEQKNRIIPFSLCFC